MAASLRLACPALAAVTVQGAGLRLDFLNLAAELKFCVLLHMGVSPLYFGWLGWLQPVACSHARYSQGTAQSVLGR